MKKLIVFVLLILIVTISYGQSPRFLFVKDNIAIDTKEARVGPEERFDFLFNKYGKWEVPSTDIPNIKLGKSDSLQKIYMIMSYDVFTSLNVPKFLNWAYSKKELIPQFVDGALLDYGRVRELKYHEPGEYTINAWDSEYITYPDNWNIPNGDGEGCDCAFDNDPHIGSKLEFTFNGRGIKVISEKVPTHGIVNVTLDGKLVKENIDLYEPDSTKVVPYTLYEINNLNSQQHTIEIEVVGKNPESSNYYFVLHRYEVTNERVEPEVIQVYDTTFIEEKVIVYDTIEVNNPTEPIGTLISKHNEYHKAIQSAIQYGGIQLTRKGYYEVWKEGELLWIKQPDIEIE